MMFSRRCRLPLICLVLLSLIFCGAGESFAANPFKSLKEKVVSVKDGMSKGKEKKEAEVVADDDEELSLDDNILLPQVPAKQHDLVVAYMNELAKDLSSRRRERVEKMREGEVVVVTIGSDQLFAPNDTLLRPTAKEFLQPYANLLRQVGLYKMIVVSHTDDTGSEEYTDALSHARANAVYDWLSNGQLSSVDLSSYALGATDPLYENNSQAHRAANRRIEIYIIPDNLIIEMAKSQKLAYRRTF